MKIKLKDNYGKVIDEVEVTDEFGAWYNDLERKSDNADRKYRYHVMVSLDSLDYEGEVFESKDGTPLDYSIKIEEERKVKKFLEILTPTQKRRLLLFMDGLTEREVASLENVNLRAVQDTKKQIQNKFITFFNYDPRQK